MLGLKDMDGLAVAVAHEQYSSLSADQLRGMCRADQPVIADLKSVFDRDALAQGGFKVFRF
jgi:UDP-N-acetyl-D-galactosamine dehydrogenase